MKYIFTAVIHKDPGSDYGISFPDFPGCISIGNTEVKTIEQGREALALHIECLLGDGENIPEPTSQADIERGEGFVRFVRLEVSTPPSDKRKITIRELGLN